MTKPGKKPAKPTPRAMSTGRKEGESEEAATARLKLRPSVNAAMTVMSYDFLKVPNVDVQLPDLVNEIAEQCSAIKRGDLGRAESMLIAQAHALDSIFAKLARVASLNIGQGVDIVDKYLRLALRAQSQCRATLETLSAIKNPPVVIARQANVTSGPQQVNNGFPLARENSIEPNKLLEQPNGQWLDGGAAGEASQGDPAMATLGAVHGAKDG